MDVTALFIHFYYYVEVSLPYELACPSVSWQVGRLFGGSVIISEKGRELHVHRSLQTTYHYCHYYYYKIDISIVYFLYLLKVPHLFIIYS